MAVKNRVHDAFLTTMENVVIPKVTKGMRSTTESSGRGPSSMVQNPDQWDFLGTQTTFRSCRLLPD